MRRVIDRSRRGAKPSTPQGELPGLRARTLVGHDDVVRSVAVLPDGLRALSGSGDRTVRLWDLQTGTELHRLEGHMGMVWSVTVLPGGRRALSGSGDGTMRLWDLQTGSALRRYECQRPMARSVAVLPDGRRVLSGYLDGTMSLWDLGTGDELRRFEGHTGSIESIAVLPDGQRALSASHDSTVRLWDLNAGREMRQFEAHGAWVQCVAVLPDGRRVLSGSVDGTIDLWDLETGIELRRFEGHTDSVRSIAALPDGRRALSGSDDGTMRLWDLETGVELRRFEGHTDPVCAVALLPDGRRALSGSWDKSLRLWDIETIGGDADNVGYTTARIALLGDSGVGKTGLGWRIAYGDFREHSSTHGQQFWAIDQLRGTRDDGTECEAVLWDLAGQPDYRLIHALFLDKVDLGLLLFDPTNRERPLAGVEYWVRHLRSATLPNFAVTRSSSNEKIRPWAPVLLIAARSDRGTPTLTTTEIEEFCRRQDIDGYVVTSARNNVGIAELIGRIKATIRWDRLTATTTTRTFKRIKEHVLKLKESSNREAVLLRPEELRERLENSDVGWRFTDDEMMTAVGHLANHGYVTRLQRASGEEAILLAPDLVVNLASSIVVEARRHERGLGLINEARLLAGDYPFPELVALRAGIQTALLDAAVGLFLQRNICFRETVNDRTWLVFPSLINEKRPSAIDSGSDDVSYRVSGAVETVYAALVVQLGYTTLFRRDHHWRNQAQYELGPGEICGFRQTAERDGEIELVLSYSDAASDDTRKIFQGTFERFLKRLPVQISRLPAVICPRGHLQERAAVRKAISNSRPIFYCDTCGMRLTTPRIDNIGLPAGGAARETEEIADNRTSYEVAIAWVKALRRDRGDESWRPTCFISYAWGDPQHERWVEQLADHLQNADVSVTFDRWHNTLRTRIDRFIEGFDFVCPVGTPSYRLKDQAQYTDPVVQAELRLIESKLMKRDAVHTVIPLLCEGTPQTAFPPLLEDSAVVDFRAESDFFVRLFELVLSIHRIPFEDNMSRKYRAALLGVGIVDPGSKPNR
jgi:WD40 repeat protein